MQPVLKIDLTNQTYESYSIPLEWQRDFLGGASLAARILYEHLTAELDPLAPESPLLILNGPLSGTAGPTVGRFVVCGKSPATGLWAESNIGGHWGPELRMAGWDGVWLTGKAASPQYIFINDGKVEFRPADSVWGQDCYELQEAIKQEINLPGLRVLGIGPAGEALIPFSLLLCDHGRVAGRTGLGAVLGSKNIKALAVKGTGQVPVLNPDAFAPKRTAANKALKNDPLSITVSALGTAGAGDYFDYLGTQPKNYYSAGVLEGADRVSGVGIAETILAGKSACHACVIACGRVVRLEDGQKRKGPEYETVVGFGPNLGITDPSIVTRLGEWCDRYGMDSISLSNTIGLAYKLYEMGIVSQQDTDGLELTWGNAEAAEQCIHKTLRREGLGRWLALGARGFAEHFGVPQEAVQVNGLEVAYHDPRGASGMALVYATSPRGACHNQSDYFLVDIGQADDAIGLEFFERQAGAEKTRNVARHQDFRTVNNALVLCVFGNVPPEVMLDLTNLACGYEMTMEEFLLSGERAWNLKRMINNRLGLTAANDTLPEPLLRPYADGGSAGYVPPFKEMLSLYYQVRGWDPVTGRPLPETLHRLGLAW